MKGDESIGAGIGIAGMFIGGGLFLGLMFSGDPPDVVSGHDLRIATIECTSGADGFEQELACFRAIYGSQDAQ